MKDSSVEKKMKPHIIRVALLNIGQIFGHEDIMNQRNYTTSVKSVSNDSELYCCSANDFHYFMHKDDRTWGKLTKMVTSRDE